MAFDIIIILALIYAVYRGFKEGIILQLGGLIGIILGVWLACRYGREAGEWLNVPSQFAYVAGFIAILVACMVVMGISGWLLGKIFNFVGLGLLNRVGGVALSLAKAVILLSVLLVAFSAVNGKAGLVNQSYIEKSRLFKPVSGISGYIFPYLSSIKDFLTEDE